MAVDDAIRGTGGLTNKAPELPTSEPAFDDGSLACLGINTDTRRKMFTCPAKSQTELVGKTFWIVDYFANIEGKDGQEDKEEYCQKIAILQAERNGGEGVARCDGDIPRMDELRKYEKP